MPIPLLVASFDPGPAGRNVIAEALGGTAEVVYLPDLADADRADRLQRATVLFARNTGRTCGILGYGGIGVATGWPGRQRCIWWTAPANPALRPSAGG